MTHNAEHVRACRYSGLSRDHTVNADDCCCPPLPSAEDVRPPGTARDWAIYARELLQELILHCDDPLHVEQSAVMDGLLNDGKVSDEPT